MDDENNEPNVNFNDPCSSDRIRRLLNESVSDIDNISDSDISSIDDSDADPHFVLSEEDGGNSDFESDNELQQDDHMEDEPTSGQDISEPEHYYGKPKPNKNVPSIIWNSNEPNQRVRTPAHNIVRGGFPGLRGTARTIGPNPNKLDVWKLIFDDQMINTIVINTNIKLSKIRTSLGPSTNKSMYKDTDILELNALVGLLLLSSILKSNDESVSSLFAPGPFSRSIFRSTMSSKRYYVLMASLRFDDAASRDQRKAIDKAAPISELFMKLIENSRLQYSTSSTLTVDEMLIPFRGRCPFQVYIPKKPKKYGIKVQCLTDAKTSYLCNAYLYSGKDSDGVGLSDEEKKLAKPTQSVIKLCKYEENSNKNITGDNWFTSIELLDELKKRGLTFVGTIKKNKREIPPEFQASRQRPEGSALFGFSNEKTLCSFVPKKNRAVILVSTMHHSKSIDEEKKKPEIICFYNKTKSGVDILDMKCAVYSSGRRTRRWPMAVFYRMLNIATNNCFILYLCYVGSPVMTRFDFTKELGYDLIKPFLQSRLEIPSLRRDVKAEIIAILGKRDNPQNDNGVPSDTMPKRKTCSKCPSAKKRKTQYKCIKCEDAICLECSRKVCVNCAMEV